MNTPVKLLPRASAVLSIFHLATCLSITVTPWARHRRPCHFTGGETEAETLGSSRRVTRLVHDRAGLRLSHCSVVSHCVLNDRRGRVRCTQPFTEQRALAGLRSFLGDWGAGPGVRPRHSGPAGCSQLLAQSRAGTSRSQHRLEDFLVHLHSEP